MADNILLVWDRMGDYHRARWKTLQASCGESRKVFAADFGASDSLYGWDNTGQDNYYTLLSKRAPGQFDLGRIAAFRRLLNQRAIETVCIAGYGRPEYLLFILYAWITRRKIILFAESWYAGNRFFDFLKGKFLALTCDGFLVSGKRAYTHFVERLGIMPSKLRIGYSVVDNDHFASQRRPRSGPKVLLCIARFASEKNLIILIRAFKLSSMFEKDWILRLVGGGPEEAALRQEAGGAMNIEFLSWQPYSSLPLIYNHAHVFVLPSIFEPWGLVVNEAMAAGLPILLSKAVGCAPDLLQEGKNGYSFSPDRIDELAALMNSMDTKSDEELIMMGINSQQFIKSYDVVRFADELIGWT